MVFEEAVGVGRLMAFLYPPPLAALATWA